MILRSLIVFMAVAFISNAAMSKGLTINPFPNQADKDKLIVSAPPESLLRDPDPLLEEQVAEEPPEAMEEAVVEVEPVPVVDVVPVEIIVDEETATEVAEDVVVEEGVAAEEDVAVDIVPPEVQEEKIVEKAVEAKVDSDIYTYTIFGHEVRLPRPVFLQRGVAEVELESSSQEVETPQVQAAEIEAEAEIGEDADLVVTVQDDVEVELLAEAEASSEPVVIKDITLSTKPSIVEEKKPEPIAVPAETTLAEAVPAEVTKEQTVEVQQSEAVLEPADEDVIIIDVFEDDIAQPDVSVPSQKKGTALENTEAVAVPKEVTVHVEPKVEPKDVPAPVVREVEVIKEVPVIQEVEVVKEVPVIQKVEVIKEVPVIEEVPVFVAPKVWRAVRGADVHETLRFWSNDSDVNLIWRSDWALSIYDTLEIRGSYEEAVQALLDQYSGDNSGIVGTLYVDPATQKRTLVIVDAG